VPVQIVSATTATNTAAGHAGAASGTATSSQATTQTVLITSFGVEKGVALVRFQGNQAQTYTLQASESLDAARWVNVSTNQTDSTGNGTFSDREASWFSVRFYRVATSQ
jgi:hypothetical protein